MLFSLCEPEVHLEQHVAVVVEGDQGVCCGDEEVRADAEAVLVVDEVLVLDVLLDHVARPAHLLAAHLSAFVERVEVVVFEVGELRLFLRGHLFADEVHLRLQQVAEARVVDQVEVAFALLFDCSAAATVESVRVR